MNRSARARLLPLILCLTISPLEACTESAAGPDRDVLPDAAAFPDASPDDPAVPGDVEAPEVPADVTADLADPGTDTPPLPPVARTMVQVPFLDGLPIDDRFISPHLDVTYYSWMFLGVLGLPAVVHKRALERAPCGQDAIEMTGTESSIGGSSAMAFIKAGPKPMDVSIWVGRPEGAEGMPRIAFTGLLQGAVDAEAVDLVQDASTATVIDGIAWARHEAHLDARALGFSILQIDHWFEGSVLLACPVASDADPAATRDRVPTPRRALRAVERDRLGSIRLPLRLPPLAAPP